MLHHDSDALQDILGEEYEQWLAENYTVLEIEDEEYTSFEKWFDNKKNEHYENLFEENFA